MIIFICSICLNNVWARETGSMDQLEKENPDDVDKMNKVLYYYNTLLQRKFQHFPFTPPFQTADFVINYKALMELPI